MIAMKGYLLASAALMALTASATAADLAARPYTKAPPMTAPVYSWTGGYFGVNAGYAFDADTRFSNTIGSLPNNNAALAAGLRPFGTKVGSDGFTGGGQIGYNYQFGVGTGVVLGVEADAAYTDLRSFQTLSNTTNFGPLVTPVPGLVTRINDYRGGLDFLGTVRGRIGYAFDRFLVYGTGGFAYGAVNNEVTFSIPGGTTPFFQGRQDGIQAGYAYGGGVEYAVASDNFLNRFNIFNSSAVTVKFEYLHYDLGNHLIAIPGVNGGPGNYTANVRNDGDIVRAGMNFKFGS
jgi:outer membrane immunogenic protein